MATIKDSHDSPGEKSLLKTSRINSQYDIQHFDAALHTAAIAELWNLTLPTWKIPTSRLSTILSHPSGRHFVVHNEGKLVGVCLTFPKSPTTACLSALVVSPAHQRQGLGTSILKHVISILSESPDLKTINISSGFPRVWPGLPCDLPAAKEFFVKNGFVRTAEASSRDFYQDIRNFEMPVEVRERAAKAGMTYGPWREDLVEECLEKQRANFGHNAAWVSAYEHHAAAKQYQEIMVVFNSKGEQIAWTLMCSHESKMCELFAFMPLVGENSGLIACVGVDKDIRGGGVGRLLMAAAMENLKSRGTEGIMIDWVVIRNFYEKLGYEVWKEYEAFELQIRDG